MRCSSRDRPAALVGATFTNDRDVDMPPTERGDGLAAVLPFLTEFSGPFVAVRVGLTFADMVQRDSEG